MPQPDGFDMLMVLKYVNVPRERRCAMFVEAEERAREREEREARVEVERWRNGLEEQG